MREEDERRMAVLEEMELRGDDSGCSGLIAGVCFILLGVLLVWALFLGEKC